MRKNQHFYRMGTLMEYTDIDAFTAHKNAGSRPAYFARLDTFIELAPKMAQNLEQMAEAGNSRDLVLALGNLSIELEKICATTIIWDVERLAAIARSAPREKYLDETFILTAKIKGLRDRLAETRISDPNAKHATPAPVADGDACELVSVKQNRSQMQARAESFEKLMVLIENFEFDAALAVLGNLIAYSYGMEIDAALVNAYNQLTAYDYESTLASLQRVLKIIEVGGQNAPPKAILAVDDVPDVLSSVKAVLGKRYNVYGVTNHKSALKFLASKHTDMILLDIELPEMDGFAMLDVIRKTKQHEQTPILFLTGNVSVENVIKSYMMGANDFIKKPVNADVLLSKVDQHMVY